MTPTPWQISPVRTTEDTAMIVGGEGFEFGLIADVTEDDDAAFIIKAVNNHDGLLTFFKWAMQEGQWEGGNLDGAAVQDKAESLGLIVSVPYDPDKHGAYNDYGCDAGDPWFEFAPGLSASVGGLPKS